MCIGWYGQTYSLVIDDLNNGSELSLGNTAVLDEDNAANLNLAPVGGLDRYVSHLDCFGGVLVSDDLV